MIVTPTTGVTAYRLQEDALSYGEFDYANGAAMLRYQVAGNFLGLPAVTVPIGYDKFGMPIGLPIALTATATQRVQTDLKEMLQVSRCVTFVSSVNRPNLFYEVCEKSSNAMTVIDDIANFIRGYYQNKESGNCLLLYTKRM